MREKYLHKRISSITLHLPFDDHHIRSTLSPHWKIANFFFSYHSITHLFPVEPRTIILHPIPHTSHPTPRRSQSFGPYIYISLLQLQYLPMPISYVNTYIFQDYFPYLPSYLPTYPYTYTPIYIHMPTYTHPPTQPPIRTYNPNPNPDYLYRATVAITKVCICSLLYKWGPVLHIITGNAKPPTSLIYVVSLV